MDTLRDPAEPKSHAAFLVSYAGKVFRVALSLTDQRPPAGSTQPASQPPKSRGGRPKGHVPRNKGVPNAA